MELVVVGNVVANAVEKDEIVSLPAILVGLVVVLYVGDELQNAEQA